MVSSKTVVGLAIAALIVVILFAVAPMIGSTIDDTYTLTGAAATDTAGWNSSVNTDLDSPAESWSTFQGLVVLAFLGVIIGIVIGAFKNMGND